MSELIAVICRYDEAVDWESTTSEAQALYRESRDHKHLVMLDGARPAVFHVRRLKTSEMRDVNAQAGSEQWLLAFRKGLVRVDDLRDPDGTRRLWTRPSDKPLNDAAVDLFSPGDVNEIGSFIVDWSILGKGRPAAWRLPATSERALEALASLHVARKKASAASSAPSSALPPAAAPQPSSPAGATPGAAPATG